jgi:hypothetical protein
MALIICPECGQKISTHADKCPFCGLPQAMFNTVAAPTAPPMQAQPQMQPQMQMQAQPQPQMQPQMQGISMRPPKPDNHMVLAIVSLVLGSFIFGIISLIYSTKVDSLWASGCYTEAISASNSARIWAIVGFVVTIFFGGIMGLVVALG